MQSLDRAFAILEMLDDLDEPETGLGVQEVSRRMSLKMPTTHNFLKSLKELGYLEQDKVTSRYRLGRKAALLGQRSTGTRQLVDVVHPHLLELNEATDETVVLVVTDGHSRIRLDQVESNQELRVASKITQDRCFYERSSGRVLLAHMTEAQQERIIGEFGMPGVRWDGIDTLEKLHAALAKIRKQGYTDILNNDLTGMSATLWEPVARRNASIGLYLPTVRCPAKRKKELRDQLLQTAARIRDILGM